MKTATKLSNATARKFFLHDCDTHYDEATGESSRCCYFSDRNWGFWVRADGEVDVDSENSNGNLPSRKVVADCVRAAVRHLSE